MKGPIASYIRHLIVTAIVMIAAKWNLPEAGLTEFAQGVALIILGSITWAIVKYAPADFKKFFGLGVIAFFAGSTFSSCSGVSATFSTPWGHVAHHEDSVAIYPAPILISTK